MNNKVFCTVFTPAYNRKELLYRLYESLVEQTSKDFEWVIIDDGSTDGTDDMIASIKEDRFSIIYKKVENGGKHRAINRGLDIAEGEVFAIVDSDDYLLPNAIETIKARFSEIDGEEKKFAGVALLKSFSETEAVGTSFSGEWVDAKTTERPKYNINGDKFEVFYTDVLKENKFPEIEGENFMTEAVVWNRLSYKGYYIRWFNDIAYICDYLDNGLTDNRDKLIRKNPKGYSLFIRECVENKSITIKQKLGYYSYYYVSCKADRSIKEIAKELKTSVFLLRFSYILRQLTQIIRKIGNNNAE